jgi:dihydrofolate synthase/folylpolyglutamate synthase
MEKEKLLNYIYTLDEFKINYSFEYSKNIFNILKNPQNDFKTIHISGTNGKGSVARILNTLICETTKLKVGLYTSPHLINYNERIKINNKEISNKNLIMEIKKIKNIFEKNKIKASFFEFKTALCFSYFKKKKIDLGIIEVGMGGENDTTNVIKKSQISIITNIDLDHIKFLGNTKRKIAKEKSGIIKNNSNFLTYEKNYFLNRIFKKKCKLENTNFDNISKKKYEIIEQNLNFSIFKIIELNQTFKINLIGNFQIKNCILAIYSYIKFCELNKIKVDFKKIKESLLKVENLGRFQILKNKNKNKNKNLIIVDGAHNENGFLELKKNVKNLLNHKNKKIIILGLSKDKKINKSIINILKQFEIIILTKGEHNSKDITEMIKELKQFKEMKNKKIIETKNVEQAKKEFDKIKLNNKNDFTLIFGSLYMIGLTIKKF